MKGRTCPSPSELSFLAPLSLEFCGTNVKVSEPQGEGVRREAGGFVARCSRSKFLWLCLLWPRKVVFLCLHIWGTRSEAAADQCGVGFLFHPPSVALQNHTAQI